MVVQPGFAPEAWGRLLQQRFETLADSANVERVFSVGARLTSQLLPHRSIGEEPLDKAFAESLPQLAIAALRKPR